MAPKSSKKSNVSQPDCEDWDFVDAILASRSARTVYLWGPPGTGKSYSATRTGLHDREVFSVTLTPEMPAAELRGFWIPKGNEFVWMDGVFIEAMRKGARIVINEISHASHDVLAILHPVLESEETARLTLPNLETVVPAPGFQVVCTDNMPVDQLPDALRDRFKSVIRVGRPHPDALLRLPDDLREAALRTFDLESERAVSIRGWLAVGEMEQEFDRPKAFRAVFGRERGEQLYNALSLGAA
jgi:MoxR-like ATPase